MKKMDDLDNQGSFINHFMFSSCHKKTLGLKMKRSVLLNNLNINLVNGDALLIQGASGTGKTSLLKAIAGIYPLKRLVLQNILVLEVYSTTTSLHATRHFTGSNLLSLISIPIIQI